MHGHMMLVALVLAVYITGAVSEEAVSEEGEEVSVRSGVALRMALMDGVKDAVGVAEVDGAWTAVDAVDNFILHSPLPSPPPIFPP